MGRCNNKRTQAAAAALRNTPSRARFSKGPPAKSSSQKNGSTKAATGGGQQQQQQPHRGGGRGGGRGDGDGGGGGRGGRGQNGGGGGGGRGGRGGTAAAATASRVIGRIEKRVSGAAVAAVPSSSASSRPTNSSSSAAGATKAEAEAELANLDRTKLDEIDLSDATQAMISSLLQDLGVVEQPQQAVGPGRDDDGDDDDHHDATRNVETAVTATTTTTTNTSRKSNDTERPMQHTDAITFHLDSDDEEGSDNAGGGESDDMDDGERYYSDDGDDDADHDDDHYGDTGKNGREEGSNPKTADLSEGDDDEKDGEGVVVEENFDDNEAFLHLTQHLSFSTDQAARACRAIEGWEGLAGNNTDGVADGDKRDSGVATAGGGGEDREQQNLDSRKMKSTESSNKLLEIAMDWLCLHLSDGELAKGFQPNPTPRAATSSASGNKSFSPIRAVPHPSISVLARPITDARGEWARSVRLEERTVALVRLGFHHSDALEACGEENEAAAATAPTGTDGEAASSVVPATGPEEDPALPALLAKLKREALGGGADEGASENDHVGLDFDALEEERGQELQALQAIYDDDLIIFARQRDAESNDSILNSMPVRRYVLSITPSQDLQQPARSGDCQLHVFLGTKYPTFETPLFLFCNSSLPPTLLRRINIAIHQKAQELLGFPVVFEVVSFVSDSLPEMHNQFIREQRRKEFDAEQVRLQKQRLRRHQSVENNFYVLYEDDSALAVDGGKLSRRQRTKLRVAEKAYDRPDQREKIHQEYRRKQDLRVEEVRHQSSQIRATYAQTAILKRQEGIIEEEAERAARAAMSQAFNRGESVEEARAAAELARKQSLRDHGVDVGEENLGDEEKTDNDSKRDGRPLVPEVADNVASGPKPSPASSQSMKGPRGSTSIADAAAPKTKPTENTNAFMDRLREMYHDAAQEKAGNSAVKKESAKVRNESHKLHGYHLDGPEVEASDLVGPSEQRVPRPVAFPAGELVDLMKDIISQQIEQPWLVSPEARAPTTNVDRSKVTSVEQRRKAETSERLQKDLKLKRRAAMEWGEQHKGDQNGHNYRKGSGFSPQRFHYMMTVRQRLPAYQLEHVIVQTIRANQITVIAGATGCGKTTQVPQLVLDDLILQGKGAATNIIVTQPRRISAIGVSERIAEERCENVGETCGYSIKLEKKMSSRTRLLLCTTGILLRRLQCDPDLAAVSHIFVDEVHERDLNTDFLIIILKDLLARRKDLKLVLMSATLNAESFSSYFGGCMVVSIPGRAHPVEEHRLEDILELTKYQVKEGSDYALKKRDSTSPKISNAALRSLYHPKYSKETIHSLSIVNENVINYELLAELLEQISLNQGEGAILVFCPGFQEIQKTIEAMNKKEYFQSSKVLIYPLHSSLSTAEQTAIFQVPPQGVRKVVVSTNIAETSITIEDVVFVVDTGRVKENRRDEVNETPTLVECWVSRASAKQRRGRAGRVQPGIAYHMYSSHTHDNELQDYQLPEMLRVGLEDLVLQILILDLGEPTTFLKKALNPPSNLALSNSLRLLEQLGAVECQWGTNHTRQSRVEEPKEGGGKSDDEEGELDVSSELTALGFHLATLPVDPRVGKMMIYGALFGCVDPMLTLASAMSARSPFMSPFDQRQQADEARKNFSVEGSDHFTILNAFDQWSELRRTEGNRAVSSFLKENFLGRVTLLQMEDLRKQFHSLLTDIGFLPKGFRLKDRDHAANANWQNQGLLRAVLCAGLYPNIIVAPRSVVSSPYLKPNKGDKQKVGEHAFQSHRKGDLYLHPSTVAFDETRLDSRYCCYHELVRTSKTYVRDCTTVNPLALLLFGGALETYPAHGICAVDGWLKFRIQARSATLIKYLRGRMERLLFEKIVSPHKDVIETDEGRALIRSIGLLFEGESERNAAPAETPLPHRTVGDFVRPWTGQEHENNRVSTGRARGQGNNRPPSVADDGDVGGRSGSGGRGRGGRRGGGSGRNGTGRGRRGRD